MPMLRIRLTGSDDTARAIINLLQSVEASSTSRKLPT